MRFRCPQAAKHNEKCNIPPAGIKAAETKYYLITEDSKTNGARKE